MKKDSKRCQNCIRRRQRKHSQRKISWEAIRNNITKHQISQHLKLYPLKSPKHHFKQNPSILRWERSISHQWYQIMHKPVRRRGREPRVAASATDRHSHTMTQKRRSMKMMTILLWPLKRRMVREGNGARLETFRMSTSKKPRHLSLPMFQRYHLLRFDTIINKWNYVLCDVYFVKGRVLRNEALFSRAKAHSFEYLYSFPVLDTWAG